MDPLTAPEDLIPPPTETNDTHKVYSVAIAILVLTVLALSVVVARLVSRARSSAFGSDDWAIIPASALYIGWSATAIYINLNAGVGKPLWEITVAEYSLWFKGIAATAWLYPIMSASIRVSIILFYNRLFNNGANAATSKALYALLGLQVLYVVVFSILPGFVCSPLYFAWKPQLRYLHCNDFYYTYTTIALYSVSLLFDLILLIFPIYPIVKLNMAKRRRIGISFIFLLGAGASVAATYKLAIFTQEINNYVNTNNTFLQYQASRFIPGSLDGYGTTFWIPCQIESAAALIGASLPALSRHLKAVTGPFVKIWSSYVSRSRTDEPSNAMRRKEVGNVGFQPLRESEVELRNIDHRDNGAKTHMARQL